MKIMKSASLAVLIVAFLLSMMAMTPVRDHDLSQVIGQAGVSINTDIMMNIAIDTLAWGDYDGIFEGGHPSWGTTADGGYVGLAGFDVIGLRIKARENDTFGGYSAAADFKPITIDVASDPTYSLYSGFTFVRFGLGSLQITVDQMDFAVFLAAPGAPGQVLGTVNLGALAMYVNPWSYVDIYNSRPGNQCGVFVTMSVVIDQLDIGYLSWGDIDGVANEGIGAMSWMSDGAQGAGYVGLSNLRVWGPIIMQGTVAIDVTTSYEGIYAHGSFGDPGWAPVSVVHIGFPQVFSLDVAGPITADVKLDSFASLNSPDAGTLGNIYISGLGIDILNRSWVDIWAH